MMSSLPDGIGLINEGFRLPLPLLFLTQESTTSIVSGSLEGLLAAVGVMLAGMIILALFFNHGLPALSEIAGELTQSFQNWRVELHSPWLQHAIRIVSSVIGLCWIIVRTPIWIVLRALGLMGSCFLLLVRSIADLLVSIDRQVDRRGNKPLTREW